MESVTAVRIIAARTIDARIAELSTARWGSPPTDVAGVNRVGAVLIA